MANTNHTSTSNKTLALNSIYNLLGQGLPILLAVVSMPLLVKSLGVERLGVLTIAWMFIGYFSIFDFGLGRALTKLIAEKIGKNQKEDLPDLIWTALALMGGLGVLGGLLLAVAAEYVTYNVLKIPASLQEETQYALYCIAFSIPIITTTSGLRGVLEANQLFKGINVIRFLLGVTTYLAPVAVCLFTKNVFLIVSALVIARLAAWLLHIYLCLNTYPSLRTNFIYRRSYVKPLLTFGGWMTTVNLCFPFLVYIERFFIGAFLSVAFVAFYTTPYDMATKLWILPGALTGTLLPALSASSALSDEAAKVLYQRVLRYILICMFPISITIVAFSNEILFYWLGKDFSSNSTLVLQMITIGVFINSFAQVAFVLLQAYGRPDTSAKILFVQIPLYIPLVIVSVKYYGINGAAAAWLLRVIVDTIIFLSVSYKYAKIPLSFQKYSVFVASVIVSTLVMMLFFQQLYERSLIYVVCIVLFAASTYKWLITYDELNRICFKIRQCVKA